ncbi:uncharacterized protein DUF385 [Kribbella steppae]|uniref:Uncharacterized protein DUF385 n=1 Tax=Kribbella steppae TaxID=2512223 RepID=A0A4R2GSY6_9ACTN|nr:nitroreductase/quinone reductase family protein [Kribbella steppae]TCO13471.1 uncharacterized protein DUF385 [Kribbella steppae]
MAVTTPLPGWLKPVNRLVKLLSRTGVPLGTIHVLSVPGRVSGAMRTTPVSPLTVDGKRYILSPLPSSDWVLNAQAAGRGLLAAGRKSTPVRLEEVADAAEKAAVLRAFPTEVPGGVSFFIRVGVVTSGSPDEFEAIAPRCVVFRVVP